MTDHEKKIVKLVREAARAICDYIRPITLDEETRLEMMRCSYKGIRCILFVQRQERLCFLIATVEWENGDKHRPVLMTRVRRYIEEDLEDFLVAAIVEHEFESLLVIAKNSQTIRS